MTGPLIRAWVWLVAASAVSTLIATGPASAWGPMAALGVLALSTLKARIVLMRYLELAEYPSLRRGFDLALGLFGLLAAVLVIAA